MSKYRNIWEPVYSSFEQDYPRLAEKITDWYPSGHAEITVTTIDGEKIAYNQLGGRLYHIYEPDRDFDFLDEDAWRYEFSRRFRNKLYNLAMTQDRLSELTGISKQTISKYVNGRATPSAHNLDLIAAALKCSVSELMYIR